jgi:hypothetical protein
MVVVLSEPAERRKARRWASRRKQNSAYGPLRRAFSFLLLFPNRTPSTLV